MKDLAEQLRDAIAAYRRADDSDNAIARAAALDLMHRLHEQIRAATIRINLGDEVERVEEWRSVAP